MGIFITESGAPLKRLSQEFVRCILVMTVVNEPDPYGSHLIHVSRSLEWFPTHTYHPIVGCFRCHIHVQTHHLGCFNPLDVHHRNRYGPPLKPMSLTLLADAKPIHTELIVEISAPPSLNSGYAYRYRGFNIRE